MIINVSHRSDVTRHASPGRRVVLFPIKLVRKMMMMKKWSAFRNIGQNNTYSFPWPFDQPCYFSLAFKNFLKVVTNKDTVPCWSFVRWPFVCTIAHASCRNMSSGNGLSQNVEISLSKPGKLEVTTHGSVQRCFNPISRALSVNQHWTRVKDFHENLIFAPYEKQNTQLNGFIIYL